MPRHPGDHRPPRGVRRRPVAGQTVLVHGVLGGVGSLAAQLAAGGGATVIGTVRRSSDLDRGRPGRRAARRAGRGATRSRRSGAHAPDGVDRIVEVSFSDNADLDAAVAAPEAVIAAYATRDATGRTSSSGRCCSPTSRSGCSAATTSRSAAKQQAADDLTAAAREGALSDPDRRPAAARPDRRGPRSRRFGHARTGARPRAAAQARREIRKDRVQRRDPAQVLVGRIGADALEEGADLPRPLLQVRAQEQDLLVVGDLGGGELLDPAPLPEAATSSPATSWCATSRSRSPG